MVISILRPAWRPGGANSMFQEEKSRMMESVLTFKCIPRKDMLKLAQRKHTGTYTFVTRVQGKACHHYANEKWAEPIWWAPFLWVPSKGGYQPLKPAHCSANSRLRCPVGLSYELSELTAKWRTGLLKSLKLKVCLNCDVSCRAFYEYAELNRN